MTGHATLETAIAAVEAGAAGYITKPVDLDTLDGHITEVLERRRKAAESARLQQGLAARLRVEPFLVASTLSLIIAQRLVRRICTSCRVSVPADDRILGMLRKRPDFERTTRVLQERGALGSGGDPWAGVRLFRGNGCPQCGRSGFRGRIGLFELYEVDGDARERIMQRASAATLREAALASGMTTMFQDGLSKALLGETTIEEVFRVAL